MAKRLYTQTKDIKREKPDVSTAPAQGMFQSRPFVVQSKTAEQSQQPDLKTSLMRAQRYGHHLSRMQPAGVSAPKAVQPKQGNGQQIESDRSKTPQALQAATVQLQAETNVSDKALIASTAKVTGVPLHKDEINIEENSTEPAEYGAHAYTQGNNVKIAPGQEHNKAHELVHVAQQKEGGVEGTKEVNGQPVNDDPKLEKEADVLGAKALEMAQNKESK
jgi:hypothetical protein